MPAELYQQNSLPLPAQLCKKYRMGQREPIGDKFKLPQNSEVFDFGSYLWFGLGLVFFFPNTNVLKLVPICIIHWLAIDYM